MMPPGHVAVTWGVTALLQKNKSNLFRLDYRLLALAALGPDLIDKPLAIFVFPAAQTSQLVAHSLVFNVVILLVALLWQRRALPYALAFVMHIVADRMWNHTESFWWPLFGWQTFWQYKPMNTAGAMLNTYLDIIYSYPQVWVVEVVALLFLIGFAWRHKFFRWPVLKQWALTGLLNLSRSL